ncbi:MAG TPA: hypothetical protein VHC19_13805 [Pirellulales bacterium]|nr:hypothetical protein [Pirellulales bacterium]
MSNNFVKKLRREATANPKKAAVLGLLLLVAGYFWAPLIRQWTTSSETAAAVAPASPPATTAAPAASTAAGALTSAADSAPVESSAKPKFHWRDLAGAIDRDPRMRPAPSANAASQREPFAFPAAPAEPPMAEPEAVVETEVTPRQLGLILSGTIVGDGRSTAVINGKVYGAGRELKAAGGVVFVVRQIEPWGIVLERGGRQFELALPRPTP